ncbi:MAG TPA: hypothetical protein VEM15_04995 [Thermodesulfobacteriota bacterium]|nr:hypothetical protein [Thermodesulfobacteriota bacterium]
MSPNRFLRFRNNMAFKKEWLQWVLEFIQMDLDSLSTLKKEKLLDEVVYFTLDPFPAIFPLFRLDDDYRKEHFCAPPEERTEPLKKRFALAEQRLKRIQGAMQSVLENVENYRLLQFEGPKKSFELCKTFSELSLVKSPWTDDNSGKFDFRIVPTREDDLVGWAKLNFAKLLTDLPLHSITKCKGCGRYFLNLTERRKIFCTPSCASRSIARRKREELRKNPKKYRAYLNKQKKYTMKRYREMRRNQLGPNVRVGRKEK